MRSGRVRSAAMQPYPWITGKFNSTVPGIHSDTYGGDGLGTRLN